MEKPLCETSASNCCLVNTRGSEFKIFSFCMCIVFAIDNDAPKFIYFIVIYQINPKLTF